MKRIVFSIFLFTITTFACSENGTDIVINIYSDYSIPDEIDRIDLKIFRAETEIVSKSYQVNSKEEFPLKILITQENNVEEVIGIEVKGKKGSIEIVREYIESQFKKKKRVNLDIYLKKKNISDDGGGGLEWADTIDSESDSEGDILLDGWDGDLGDAGLDELADELIDVLDTSIDVGCSGGCGANASCENGRCKCNVGFDNCNNDWSDGCETDVFNSLDNCGFCKTVCNVKNVKKALCNKGVCDYSECLLMYEDSNKDRTDGCERFNYFPKRYGGDKDEFISDMIKTSDGGLLVVGTTMSCCFGDKDIWVLKLNNYGDVEWQRVIGGKYEEKEQIKLLELSSGGYYIIGSTYSYGRGATSGLVIKLDNSGNILKSLIMDNNQWIRFFDINCSNFGDCIILGSSGEEGLTGLDLLEVTIDKNLNIQSNRLFKINNKQGGNAFILNGGYSYIYVSLSEDNTTKNKSTIIIMLDKDMSIYSSKELYRDGGITPSGCVQVSSDGMLCSGYSDDSNPNKSDIIVFKFNYSNKGSIGWQKGYGDKDIDIGFISSASNLTGIYITGVSFQESILKGFLINLDTAGNERFIKSYYGSLGDGYMRLIRHNNEAMLLGGITNSYSIGVGGDIIIVPVDMNGNNISMCHLANEKEIGIPNFDPQLNLRDISVEEIKQMNYQFTEISIGSSIDMKYTAGSICE